MYALGLRYPSTNVWFKGSEKPKVRAAYNNFLDSLVSYAKEKAILPPDKREQFLLQKQQIK